MNNFKINDEMLKILSSIKGDIFLNYECELEDKYNRTFQYLRINTNNKSIDISNDEKEVILFGELEDVAYFKLFESKNKSLKESFNLNDNFNSLKININEIINNIYII